MNIRTLKKKDSLHLINLGSIVLAWSVTQTYFEWIVPNSVIGTMEYFLLAPAVLLERATLFLFDFHIIGNVTRMFFALWISYFVAAFQLSGFLIVKNYDVSELKSWYVSRK